MNRVFRLLIAVAVMGTSGLGQTAEPVASSAASSADRISIPFNPPIGESLRYRVEEVVDQEGHVTRSGTTYEFGFEAKENGFRFVVTPLSTSSEVPLGAIEDQSRALLLRPFALSLDRQGEIVGMEDEQAYWDAIMSLVESGAMAVADTTERREIARRFIRTARELPEDDRLSLLVTEIRPLLRFASVEMVVGQREISSVEVAWLLGGSVATQVETTLDNVADGRALVSQRSSVPRETLEQATRELFQRYRPEDGRDAGDEASRLLAGFERLSRETDEDYVISLASGLAERFRSTETVEVGTQRRAHRVVTVRTMERMR